MAKWIQGAIAHPGAETRAADRAGESTHAYMESREDAPGTAGARARLGLRLEAMHGGRHGSIAALKRKTR